MLSAEQIARRLSPDDQPDLIKPRFVSRRMSAGEWPSTKIGRHRGMTEQQFEELLALTAVSPAAPRTRSQRPSGVSPRSRTARIAGVA